MALVKAHITLEESVAADAEARSDVLRQIVRLSAMSQINQKRFERYGILTGMVEDSRLDSIRGITGVSSVEVDSEKYLRPPKSA